MRLAEAWTRPDRAPAQALRWLSRTWSTYRVVAYFLAGLVALDLLLVASHDTWRAHEPEEYADRVRNCRQQSHDLLVIGGSPVCEGIDPGRLVGLSWHGHELQTPFNLGLPGATTSDTWHVLLHSARVPPRLLVYGITASDVNDARLEPQGARAVMTALDLVRWGSDWPDTARWVLKHYFRGRVNDAWQLYRYRNALRLAAAERVEACWPGLCPDGAAEARANLQHAADLRRCDGYAPQAAFRERRLDLVKAAGPFKPIFRHLDHYCLGNHLNRLHRIIDWAAAHGTDLVLVDMPVAPDLDVRRNPREFAAYRAALAEVERTRCVTVLRASPEAVGLNDSDFADWVHLNAAGAARLSAWLRHELTTVSARAEETP